MDKQFSSLDLHTTTTTDFDQPDRYRALFNGSWDQCIAQGAGISYIPASFGEKTTTVGLRRFNRILEFDPEKKRLCAEAGITLGELYSFLTPRGFYLAVQPGHPQITLGGCVAVNVHGKNQFQDGTFKNQVDALTLFHPDHGLLQLSNQTQPDLFHLTVGGFGLTGFIVNVTLKLTPLPSHTVRVKHIPFKDPFEAAEQMMTLKTDHDLLYAWLDFGSPNAQGKGYLVTGSYLEEPSQPNPPAAPIRYKPLQPSKQLFRPFLFRNKLIPWINRLYYLLGVINQKEHQLSLFQFLFPAVGKEFYFNWFGQTGFLEQQNLVPHDAFKNYVQDFRKLLKKKECAVALTTLKLFQGEQTLLNYDGTGFSFTLDFANHGQTHALMAELDAINRAYGVISNLSKDSRLPLKEIQHQYPEWTKFSEQLHQFDPQRRFQSHLSQRLGL
ncbi:FAD-binding oxidoreductase [Magnetococcales bacterium HHB-1]